MRRHAARLPGAGGAAGLPGRVAAGSPRLGAAGAGALPLPEVAAPGPPQRARPAAAGRPAEHRGAGGGAES